MKLRLLLIAAALTASSCASIEITTTGGTNAPTQTTVAVGAGDAEVLGTSVVADEPQSKELAPQQSDTLVVGVPGAGGGTDIPDTDGAVPVLNGEGDPALSGEPDVSAVGADEPVIDVETSEEEPADSPTTTAPTTTTTEATTTTAEPRFVQHNNFDPFATVGGFTMYLPAREVELIGYHESNHDGSQNMDEVVGIVPSITMESRDRGNGARSAVDIAVNSGSEIRSPVTGTVVRAGTYTLYCDHKDDYAVIAPDEQPTWEVKILHIDGVQVKKGDRVVAQETVLAPKPTKLPFRSQIDKLTVSPPPPHVHIEVVDPSIPDRPSGGC